MYCAICWHIARNAFESVVLSDNSILVMGGGFGGTVAAFANDVWKSEDGGKTWIAVTLSAAWTGKWVLQMYAFK